MPSYVARRKQQAIFELVGAIDYEPSRDLATLRGKPRRKKGRAQQVAEVIVLVDTTIWSLALRRRTATRSAVDTRLLDEWSTLVREGRAVLIGPIRQELLSGIRDASQFAVLRGHLGAFANVPIEDEDYVVAAELFNRCRSHGVSAASVDMLISAVAHRVEVFVFTTDVDFAHYGPHTAVRPHRPRVVAR